MVAPSAPSVVSASLTSSWPSTRNRAVPRTTRLISNRVMDVVQPSDRNYRLRHALKSSAFNDVERVSPYVEVSVGLGNR